MRVDVDMLAHRLPRPDCYVLLMTVALLQLSRGVELLSKLGPPPMGAAQWGAGRWLSCYWLTRGYIYTVSTLYIYASHGRYIDIYLELEGWGTGQWSGLPLVSHCQHKHSREQKQLGRGSLGVQTSRIIPTQLNITHTAADGALMRG